MKKIFVMLVGVFLSVSANATVYWTVKAENGVHTTSSGMVAINIGNYQPTGPNPSSTVWEACSHNWIYLHKAADGTIIEDKYVDRMLSVALAAYKTDSRIRVAIDRDASGRCYSAQVFDQGQ
uniref:Secreted protein n=1 Tax=Candidatus Kentrum sp. SD TaxID=2126332 RepID=A0A451BSU3_9GAMM|nr:MAG: hypothetical protein BECKSD772D_GA0070982_13152 [Candidatus Kentron sp. SD]